MLQKFSVSITFHLCMFSLLVETVLRNCFHCLDGLDEAVHPECRRSKFCQHSFNSFLLLDKNVICTKSWRNLQGVNNGVIFSQVIHAVSYLLVNLLKQASDVDLCCICFDQVCTIEVRPCGHQMCAHCTLALCCHKKPNPTTACPSAPVCPFCRSSINQLVVAEMVTRDDLELEHSLSKPRRSRKSNFSEGSSSFKSLSTMGSFARLGGRSPGKVAAECDVVVDKPWNSSPGFGFRQSDANVGPRIRFGIETQMGMNCKHHF